MSREGFAEVFSKPIDEVEMSYRTYQKAAQTYGVMAALLVISASGCMLMIMSDFAAVLAGPLLRVLFDCVLLMFALALILGIVTIHSKTKANHFAMELSDHYLSNNRFKTECYYE